MASTTPSDVSSMAVASPDAWEETLEAAMAFLHEFESASLTAAMLSPSVSTSTSREDSDEEPRHPISAPVTVADRQRQRQVAKRVHRNRARDRERRELLRLREELAELEARHAQLKQAPNPAQRGGSHLAPRVHDDELAVAWRRIAMRQAARRQDAQNEKVRLTERVAEQWNVLQCLKRIIERQLAEEARQHHTTMPLSLVAGSAVRSEVVGRLLETSKQMFAITGSWEACPGLGQASNSAIRMLSPTQLVVEVVDRRLIPFGYQAVGDAYWQALVNSQCASNCFFEKETVVDGRDTIIRGQSFGGDNDTFNRGSSIRRQTYVTVQRFFEPGRVVITNTGLSEFVQVAQQALPGTKIEEQYWHVAEAPQSSSSDDATYMTTLGRVLLDFQHEPAYALPLGSILANYFNSGLGPTFENTVASVEDVLLQNSVPSSSTS